MEGTTGFDEAAQSLGEGVMGTVEIGEPGVATRSRYLLAIEQRRRSGHLEHRHVRVPGGFAGAQGTDWPAVLDDVGDELHRAMEVFRLAAILLSGGVVQPAETQRKGYESIVGNVLAAEPKHQVTMPGVQDLAENVVVSRFVQVDSEDVGAQCLA